MYNEQIFIKGSNNLIIAFLTNLYYFELVIGLMSKILMSLTEQFNQITKY